MFVGVVPTTTPATRTSAPRGSDVTLTGTISAGGNAAAGAVVGAGAAVALVGEVGELGAAGSAGGAAGAAAVGATTGAELCATGSGVLGRKPKSSGFVNAIAPATIASTTTPMPMASAGERLASSPFATGGILASTLVTPCRSAVTA